VLFPDLSYRKSAVLLAVSDNLVVFKVYEYGFVSDGTAEEDIGAIYGDPKAACIADDESWCAIGGATLWLCLALPDSGLLDKARIVHVPSIRWINALWTIDARRMGFVTSPSRDGPQRLGHIDVDTLEVVDYLAA
jgi:hypothetical protein